VFTVFNYIKKSFVTKIPIIRYAGGEATTFREKCTVFLTTLFPSLSSSEESRALKGPVYIKHVLKYVLKPTWPALRFAEIQRAIFTIIPGKAPGPDRINGIIVKKAAEVILNVFELVYATLLKAGYYPACWKSGIGVILVKLNKPDYIILKAYRVVTLLNCLGKVLKKVVAKRLSFITNTESDRLLYDNQFGGRSQRSAVDAGLLLLNYVQSLKSRYGQNAVMSIALLDVKGAFDRVLKPALSQTLKELNLPDALIKWVDSFINGRFIQLSFEGQIQEKVPYLMGLPQGSPVSPILYLIHVAGIVASKGFQLSYIDDFSITIGSTLAKKNCKQLEEAIRDLVGLGNAVGVEFEAEKTELIYFHNHREKLTDIIRVRDFIVKPKAVVRWLGLFLDRKFKFNDYVDTKFIAVNKAFEGLQRLGNT
jgi:hypothetical protein